MTYQELFAGPGSLLGQLFQINLCPVDPRRSQSQPEPEPEPEPKPKAGKDITNREENREKLRRAMTEKRLEQQLKGTTYAVDNGAKVGERVNLKRAQQQKLAELRSRRSDCS